MSFSHFCGRQSQVAATTMEIAELFDQIQKLKDNYARVTKQLQEEEARTLKLQTEIREFQEECKQTEDQIGEAQMLRIQKESTLADMQELVAHYHNRFTVAKEHNDKLLEVVAAGPVCC
jgi:septal ring factor EnvC (AmiA/AmiB activator)